MIEVFFSGGEVLRAEANGMFSRFVHDLAMQTVADWEAGQANEPAPAAAD